MNDFYFKPFGVLPIPIPILPFDAAVHFGLMIIFMLFAILLGLLLDCYTKKNWQQSSAYNKVLPVIGSALLFLRFNISVISIKGLILLFILLYASNSDIKKREVSDWVAIVIIVTALIDIEIRELPFMLIAAVCIFIPQLLIAIQKGNRYGGADIKIMTACTFLLGLEKGLVAIIIGLTLAVLITYIKRKIKKQDINQPFPMIPFLAVGSFIALIL